MAMADGRAPVYGRPTLYGEYEINAADVSRAGKMYGDVPRVASIRAPKSRRANVAKHPVRPKGAIAKKSSKKVIRSSHKKDKVRANKKQVVTAPDVALMPAPPIIAVPKRAPVASPDALAIADALKTPDIDSFCVTHDTSNTGRVPDGFVLMPGRPDLVSCGKK